MKIQDAMLKQILDEIKRTEDCETPIDEIDLEKAKKVARMLVDLSTSPQEATDMTGEYIANIKHICN